MNQKNNLIRARYVGYTKDTENHGDEALMWIIRQLLLPEIDVVFEGDEYDVALLGGGTLINQSPWILDWFRSTLQKAPMGGIVFGTGVGDTDFWGNNLREWSALLEKCPLVGVRGPRSVQYLNDVGVTHAEMIGDPYLAMRPPTLTAPTSNLIGVNLGTTNNSLWGGDEPHYIQFMEEVLLSLKEAGWQFLFISVWSKDLPILERIRDQIGDSNSPVLDARHLSWETLAKISSCQIFIGEKLHACAMAAITQVPFVSLEYQPKVRDFSESLNLGEYTISTASRSIDALLALVEKLSRTRELARIRLASALDSNRSQIHDFSRRVKSSLLARQKRKGAGG
jgi:polysaccharide pyruvyl transferase WcaK-like protein